MVLLSEVAESGKEESSRPQGTKIVTWEVAQLAPFSSLHFHTPMAINNKVSLGEGICFVTNNSILKA